MTDNGAVVWEDPPDSPYSHRVSWTALLEPLTERPGQWAKVHEMPANSAWSTASLLRRQLHRVPAGRWEFTARRSAVNPDRGHVYARYLGPEDGAE